MHSRATTEGVRPNARENSQIRPSTIVRAARAAGSHPHLASVLLQGLKSANIYASSGVIRGIPVQYSGRRQERVWGAQRPGAKTTLSRPQPAAETVRPAFEPAKMPANRELFVRDQKTPVRIGLRGGPGRTRTSNQTVMSGP